MHARHAGVMAAIAMAVGMASAAGAATMTFDGIEGYVEEYSEDGIAVVGLGGQVGPFRLPGTAHLDDGGSGYAGALSFTMAAPFDAVSFDVFPTSNDYQLCRDVDGDTLCEPYAFENVQVTGYAGGVAVASDTFDMVAQAGTYAFGAAFTGLDRLIIGFAPEPDLPTLPSEEPYLYCYAPPCTHYSIDNVTLRPSVPSVVPLPATGALLGLALPTLLLLRRRRA